MSRPKTGSTTGAAPAAANGARLAKGVVAGAELALAGRSRRLAQAVHERAEPLARAGARRGREAAGKPDVGEEEHERDRQAQREEAGLRPDARPEDGVVPDALEPRGVRYELEADPHQEDRAEQDPVSYTHLRAHETGR